MSTERIQACDIQVKPEIECRAGCGACCIAPSISSPIPGMPNGKPAGVRCIQLNDLNQCLIFGLPTRPRVCSSLKPTLEMCGHVHQDAFLYLQDLELATSIASSS